MRTIKRLLLQTYQGEPTDCMVECNIDLENLLQRLGNSAWRNKSKKARALNNLITVRVRETEASKEQKRNNAT
jgi:hypothetical protein